MAGTAVGAGVGCGGSAAAVADAIEALLDVAEPLSFQQQQQQHCGAGEEDPAVVALRDAMTTALDTTSPALLHTLMVQHVSHYFQHSLLKALDVSQLFPLGLADGSLVEHAAITEDSLQQYTRASKAFAHCIEHQTRRIDTALAKHRDVGQEAKEMAFLRLRAGLSLLVPVSVYKDLEAMHVHILWRNERDDDDEEDEEEGEEEDEEEEEEEAAVATALKPLSVAHMTDYLNAAHTLLDACGLGESITLPVLKSSAAVVIDKRVQQTCAGEYEEAMLPSLLEWFDGVIAPFLHAFMPASTSQDTSTYVERELRLQVHKALGRLRVAEMFDIIIEYPSSLPAIHDVKTCLDTTPLRPHLISSLRQALQKRLLHPGPQTSDIINQYISTVKTLRTLDATGVLLELVCNPVREYLKRRPDTVRCIVELLIGEDADDFTETSDKDVASEDWVPDPVDADPDHSESMRKDSVLDLLTSIYGSKELLVEEYSRMLAESMLKCRGFDIDEEIRTTEMLKARFGEEYLRRCAVMIKDFANSRRLHHAFETSPPYETTAPYRHAPGTQHPSTLAYTAENVRVYVLSRLFWPNLKDDKLNLPEELETHLKYYLDKFKGQTQMQTLELRRTMGTVELTVELDNRTVDLTVPPVAAAALMKFQEQKRWSLDDLTTALGASSQTVVLDGLRSLIGPGVVVQVERGVFEIDETGTLQQAASLGDDGVDDAGDAEVDAREEELEAAWMMIQAMLETQGEHTAAEIFQALQLFLEDDQAFNGTEQDLKRYLDKQVEKGALTKKSQRYMLPS